MIAAIYEAGMDFSLWPSALGRIAAAFGAPSAGMARQGETLSECRGFSFGVELDYEKKYFDYYHSVNPIWQRASSTPAGTVQTDTMVVPRSDLSRTEFFNNFLAPQRMEFKMTPDDACGSELCGRNIERRWNSGSGRPAFDFAGNRADTPRPYF